MTDPPIIGDLGVLVGKRVGAPVLVISQDVFPEIATELDRLRNPGRIGVLRGLVGAYLRRADRIVAIGETMRDRLEAKGAPPERLRVIPNWVTRVRSRPARDTSGREARTSSGASWSCTPGKRRARTGPSTALVRAATCLARPRRHQDRHCRASALATGRWSHWPIGLEVQGTVRVSPVPESGRACRSPSRARTCIRRRPRERARRIRRPEAGLTASSRPPSVIRR
jgi:glycosyltransferase involved in cell wall biosynthesis